MQLTHKEIDEKRRYTLLNDLNSNREIDMSEMERLCKGLGLRVISKETEDGRSIYGLRGND